MPIQSVDWLIMMIGAYPHLFQMLNACWGPRSVDCFASPENKKVQRFHSRFWSPGCEAVDTFTVIKLVLRGQLVGTSSIPYLLYNTSCL